MTKEEMKQALLGAGMKKDYKVSWDDVIRFDVRGGHEVKDGLLRGTEIVLAKGELVVWTAKTRKARDFTKARGIKMRELTGECEFRLPASQGDEFLTIWGAKVKRVASEALKSRLDDMRRKAQEAKNTLAGARE